MTAQRDLDTILAAWLDEGPTVLPDPTRRAIVTALPTTTQARRGPLAPWRLFDMNGFGRLAAAALVAVVAVGGAIYVIAPRLGPGDRSSPSPLVTAPATQAAEPTYPTVTFTSTTYGYSLEIPEGWASRQATTQWPEGGPIDPDQDHADKFKPRASVLGPAAMAAAQPIPDGTTGEDWMTAWADQRERDGGMCFGPASAWSDATVAGVAARRLEAACVPESGVTTNFVEYVFVIDGTGYIITGAPPSVIELMAESFQGN